MHPLIVTLFITILTFFCLAAAQAETILFVSPRGKDTNAGTVREPLATLEGARDAIRVMKAGRGIPAGGVTVIVGEGEYARTTPFVLEAQDSGTADAPIIYRAKEGETVRITGAQRIPAAAFGPVVDGPGASRIDAAVRSHVRQVNLKALGILDTGTYPDKYRVASTVAELFFNDTRQTLAQWPNEGWTIIKDVVDTGSIAQNGTPVPGGEDRGPRLPVFTYEGDRPARWAKTADVWLHGYWAFDWFDEVMKVKEINPEQKRITLAMPHGYGVRQGNAAPRRFRAINLLEELDAPGEYYIDGPAGVLYFRPPGKLDGARVTLSLATALAEMRDVSFVRLRGLTFEDCRGDAIMVLGGSDVRMEGCTVRNTGMQGINIEGGEKHQVVSCDIHDTGTMGVRLSGGDRKTLTPSGHRAVNNHIYRFGRRQRTYASGLHVQGVGVYAGNNLLHDAPHQAIGVSGNDHVFEYNVVHHVCLETDDAGAFYKGRDPSSRGNVIRYNFWHHTGAERSHGNNTIYFDDGDGGETVFGNVFFRAGQPGGGTMGSVFSHGGHDNVIDNNIFIECKRAIGATPWNDKRWMDMVRGELWQTRLLQTVDITKPPYTTRYPAIIGLMDPPTKPRMNTATRNVAVMCGDFIVGNYTQQDNYVTDKDPGFVNIAKGDFRLKPDSEVFKKVPGFQPIPFEKMGLYHDRYRRELPKTAWNYPAPRPLPPLKSAPGGGAVERTGPVPVYAAARSDAPVTIDGEITPAEWNGADAADAMKIAVSVAGQPVQPVSYAWLRVSGGDLLVAVDVHVPLGSPLQGDQWGGSDAVEVALRNPAQDAPLWVLRGYTGGKFETLRQTTSDFDVKPAPMPGAQYAAKNGPEGHWSAECRIPLAAVGIDPAAATRTPFNITVRRIVDNQWVMWEATRGNSNAVDRAGILEIPAR